MQNTGIATELDPRVQPPFRARPHELPNAAVRRAIVGGRVDPSEWPRSMHNTVRVAGLRVRVHRDANA